ncbi:MAG: DNA recombination protein RmuC [Treponema sp.]|jgi:DNA recombination protein RmuC|nr:DNA recombination protein RmuC [Treponema sp.]
MDAGFVVGLMLLTIVIIQFIVMIIFFLKNRRGSQEDVSQRLVEYAQRLEKNESTLRDEFGKNREETGKAAKDSREELSLNLKSVAEQLSVTITGFTGLVDNKIKSILDSLEVSSKSNRDELAKNMGDLTVTVDNKMKSIQEFLDSGLKFNREELNKSILTFEGKVTNSISSFSETLDRELKSVADRVYTSTRESREELSVSLKTFEERSSAKIEVLTKDTKEGLEKTRDSVEKKLADLQQGNEKKLDEMRQTVDEKLHRTLETRLGESFKLVSERLELVQKGLGEMQTLVSDVGSIKNVLSNVKNKGVLGEYQLGAILEQVLTPNQYAQSVKIKEGSRENVEFAVKIPSKEDSGKIIWLPIDAKFPTADYEILLAAYESGEKETGVQAQKDLKIKIEKFARDIREKYIDPPNTTEFGIMFLPFEGLYAEVLRIPGLFETIQNTYRVTITGPTTISAFLNSLQMGFRSLAVEKRTSEIWDLLGAVRTEFGKFGDVLQKTKEKLDSASKEIDKAGTRSRAIERKLRDVQTLPEGKAKKLLSDIDVNDVDDIIDDENDAE